MSIFKTLVQLSMLSREASQLLPEEKSGDSKQARFMRLFLSGLFVLAVLLVASYCTNWIKGSRKNWVWICFFAVAILAAFTMRKIDKDYETTAKDALSDIDDGPDAAV